MKIKVAFILLGLDFSGAERVLVDYLKDNAAVEPFFYFIYNGNSMPKFEREFSGCLCKCLNLKYSKNLLRFFPIVVAKSFAKQLKRELEKIDVDVVYANNTLEFGLLYSFIKETNLPVVGHIHDMRDAFGTYPKIWLVEKSIKKANAVISVSKACASSWKNEKIQVVYNGVSNFFECSKKRKSFLTLGFVGILCKRKGFDLFVNLVRKRENLQYKVAYNKLRKECQNDLKKLKESKNVEIYYDLSKDQMDSFYNLIDILVVPSRFDPFPTVILEAVSRKVLILASRTDGILEMVNNDALLFEKNNLEDLIKCVDNIVDMNEDERERILENLFLYVKNNFNQEKKKETINLILENVVRKSR